MIKVIFIQGSLVNTTSIVINKSPDFKSASPCYGMASINFISFALHGCDAQQSYRLRLSSWNIEFYAPFIVIIFSGHKL